MAATRLLLVGCGKMGSALLGGWKANKEFEITVLDPSFPDAYKTPSEIPDKSFDIIVLATKPQVMTEVINTITNAGLTSSLYISIAAGKTLENLEDILPDSQAIIRTMPNTPALIGQGITVACANLPTTAAQKAKTEALFKNTGQFEWVTDETSMNTVTAVSGSGPAYVFLLIEELTKAAMSQGLPEHLATKLARQTVIGSAALAAEQPEISAATLRQNVTSPGGTTEAALKVLMADNGLSPLMEKAIEAATLRGKELSR